MFVTDEWLLLLYVSPVLSIVPVMLVWQGIVPLTAAWQKLRVAA